MTLPKTPLKGLLLDFGSVISYSVFEQHAISEVHLGLPVGSLTWRGPFDPEGDQLWQKMQRGEMSERDYWTTRAKQTGELLGHDDWGMLEFLRASRDFGQLIRPEITQLIFDAKAAGFKVGILSNELELFYGPEVFQDIPILAVIDACIDATHTHILKPDPRAYALAADALALPLAQILFVDDQLKNIKGAQAIEMPCVHFDITCLPQTVAHIRQTLQLSPVAAPIQHST